MISFGPTPAPLSPYDLATRMGRRETGFREAAGATIAQTFDLSHSIGRAFDWLDDPSTARAPRLSKEEYERSPFYRPEIEHREDMTAELAEHLAQEFDRRRYRESLIARYDGGFLGQAGLFGASLLTQATDPINYIPFLGSASRAYMVSRLGAIGGRAAAGAADAAIGTALFSAATAPDLIARGEDIGFDDIALEITMGAAIGAAFGGAAGYMSRRQAARALGRDGLQAALDAVELASVDVNAGRAIDVSPIVRGSLLGRNAVDRLIFGAPLRSPREGFEALDGVATARAAVDAGATPQAGGDVVPAALQSEPTRVSATEARRASNVTEEYGGGDAPASAEPAEPSPDAPAPQERAARAPDSFFDPESPDYFDPDKLELPEGFGELSPTRLYGQASAPAALPRGGFAQLLGDMPPARVDFSPIEVRPAPRRRKVSAQQATPIDGQTQQRATTERATGAAQAPEEQPSSAPPSREGPELTEDAPLEGERALEAEVSEFEKLKSEGHLDADAVRLADEASEEADQIEGWADSYEDLAVCVVRFGS